MRENVDEESFCYKRPDGRFNVLKADADRPSAVTDTQKAAIAKAKELRPCGAQFMSSEFCNVEPGPDKFREI